MSKYVILMRGINVGGKNKVSMSELKTLLGELGFTNVTTFINSGNVIADSELSPSAVSKVIEDALPTRFKLDSTIIRILALDEKSYKKVITQSPKGFGDVNPLYRYYVLFPMGIKTAEAMEDIEARPDIDTVWAGDHAIYFRFPSLESPDRNRSWLNRIVAKPVYHSITMRNWATTTKLLELLTKK